MQKRQNYEAWNVNEIEFPHDGLIEDQIKFILRYGILAASTFNSQPWKCEIKKNKLKVFLDYTRVPKKSDKSGRFAFISIGCFIQNTIIASEYFGLNVNLEFEKKINNQKENKHLHLANITFSKIQKSFNNSHYFSAITKRVTNRSIYLNKSVPEGILNELESLNNKEQKIIPLNKSYQSELVEISKTGDMNIWTDKEFRKEHLGWVRNNITKKFDGMPAFGVGIGLIPSFFARPIILSPVFAKLQAKKNCLALISSQNYITLCSKDDIVELIKLGMLFGKIQLYLSLKGISVGPMGQFIEDNTARNKLKIITNKFTKLNPQLFFRIGYPSKDTNHSPRIPVDKILINDSSNTILTNLLNLPVKQEKIAINKHLINYATLGSGEPLIIIHGLNMGWGQWYTILPELAKYFKVYAIDLPGAGDSSGIKFKNLNLKDDFIATVTEFIKKNNLNNINILGHSTGGLIALKLGTSQNKKIKKIIAIDPLGLTDYVPPRFKPLAFYPIANLFTKTVMKPTIKNLKSFLVSAMHNKSKLDDSFLSYYHHYIMNKKNPHPFLLINRITGFFKIKSEFLVSNDMKRIDKPTLIIFGDKDPFIPLNRVKEQLESLPQNIKLEIISNSGHVPFFEKPAEFKSIVLNFLKDSS